MISQCIIFLVNTCSRFCYLEMQLCSLSQRIIPFYHLECDGLMTSCAYYFSGSACELLQDYLSHCISLEGVTLSLVLVSSCVTQGSILGSLLFFIYVNDLPSHTNTSPCLFADDCKCFGRITSLYSIVILTPFTAGV